MKRITALVVLLIGFFSFTIFASAQEDATSEKTEKKEGKITAEEVLRNLDLDKNTKAHIQEYVKETKGKTVYGKGKVVDVTGKKGNFKVRVKIEGNIPPAAKGEYNVTLFTEKPDAANLKKGDRIKFEGTFQPRRGAFYGTTTRQRVGLSVDNVVGDYTVIK